MELGATLGVVAVAILVYVHVLFVLSLILKRNDIADIGWGIGILLVGTTAVLYQETTNPVALLTLILTAAWAVRLAVRIFLRNIKKGEDARYKKWRDTWGRWFYLRSYAQVYLLQGTLMVAVGYPLLHVAVYGVGSALTLGVLLGALVWAIGFVFEVVGDYQLDRHLRDPGKRGQLLRSGLWRYSRHPNYFGEVTLWWGVWLAVLSVPYGAWAVVGPLTITFLILKVSGVPMLEKSMAAHPDFAAYAQATSVFIPLPPKGHDRP